MKQTIKYLILALLIPAAYCFTACDTDIEPIDQQIIKPDPRSGAVRRISGSPQSV